MESSGDHDEVLKNIDLNRIGNSENLKGQNSSRIQPIRSMETNQHSGAKKLNSNINNTSDLKNNS